MPIAPTPQLKASMFGRMPVGGVKRKGGAPAPRGPSGVRIEHRIGVQAPAEVIWELLYDLEGWSRWNPVYTRASGQVRIGQPLSMTMTLPGDAPREIQPVVLEWVPHEQLHLKITAAGGLVRTVRYVEIEALSETGCIVSNGEIFGGLLGPTGARRMGGRIYKGFRLMNEALKAEAEAVWGARAGGG
jgi:hypothetical protein